MAERWPPGPVGGRLPAPTDSGAADSGGTAIAWRAYGEGPGDPVLLIMGFLGSGRMWWRLLGHLGTDRRAITIDNRGTGDSDRPGGEWTMAEMTADCLAVLDDAGAERAHVVGASMGGMIAQHVALEAPQRVSSLTLACTTPGGSRQGPPPWRMLASILVRPVLGVGRSLPIVAPLLYAERTRREQPDRMREDFEVRVSDATPLATARGQGAAIRGHDTREHLAALDVPTLVLHGEADRLVPPAAGRELADRIPGARLAVMHGCGHLLTTDGEDQVVAVLREFLAEHDPVGAGAVRTGS